MSARRGGSYHRAVPRLRLTAQKRRPERANLFLDDEYWRAATYDTVALLGIVAGDLTDEQVEVLSLGLDGRDAFDAAMRSLSFRARTARELTDKLRTKQHEPHAIEYAIGRLGDLGLLNDRSVARQRAEVLRDRGRGRRFSEQALGQLGVSREDTAQILDEVYANADMRELVLRTLGRGVDLDEPIDARTRNRLHARLARAGHTNDDIRRVLDQIPAVAQEPTERRGAARPARSLSDEQLAREIARRFPTAHEDYAERRRAMGWCARRGVGHQELRDLLDRIAQER